MKNTFYKSIKLNNWQDLEKLYKWPIEFLKEINSIDEIWNWILEAWDFEYRPYRNNTWMFYNVKLINLKWIWDIELKRLDKFKDWKLIDKISKIYSIDKRFLKTLEDLPDEIFDKEWINEFIWDNVNMFADDFLEDPKLIEIIKKFEKENCPYIRFDKDAQCVWGNWGRLNPWVKIDDEDYIIDEETVRGEFEEFKEKFEKEGVIDKRLIKDLEEWETLTYLGECIQTYWRDAIKKGSEWVYEYLEKYNSIAIELWNYIKKQKEYLEWEYIENIIIDNYLEYLNCN